MNVDEDDDVNGGLNAVGSHSHYRYHSWCACAKPRATGSWDQGRHIKENLAAQPHHHGIISVAHKRVGGPRPGVPPRGRR